MIRVLLILLLVCFNVPALAEGDVGFCESLLLDGNGINLIDSIRISQTAKERKLMIAVIAPNAESLRFRFDRRARPKPMDLKACKSAVAGEVAGLVNCPPTLFDSMDEWHEEIARLAKIGYEVLGPEENYLVKRVEDGRIFHSDYDLLFVVEERGFPGYSEELRMSLNRSLGRRMIRHGPLADYEGRHKIRIKYPIIVFMPDGTLKELGSRRALRNFYNRNGLTWPF